MHKLLSCLIVGGVVLALGACVKPAVGGGGETAAPAGNSPPVGDTMADATLDHQGSLIQSASGCSTSGYAKFDCPVGAHVKMDVSVEGPAGSCLSVSYLKASGGAVDGMMKELCIDKNGSESWDVAALAEDPASPSRSFGADMGVRVLARPQGTAAMFLIGFVWGS